MAENTSVGNATISLDIEASGDLKAQIEKMTGVIRKQIEASLKNIGNLDFKGLAETISNTISKAIDNSIKNIQQSINKSINSAMSNVKGIKIPVDFGAPTDSPAYKDSAVSSVSTPRAPPLPKINTGVNLEVIKSQIYNLSSSIDITNAKIEQQQEKLVQLKESYNMAFDSTRKNKLQEEILKAETSINKLTATSDKAGFKLADLDAQFAALSNMAKDATAGVNAVDNKLKQTANTATKTSDSIKQMSSASHDMSNSFHNSHNSMSMFFGTMVKWGLIFPIIVRGITAIGTSIRNSLMINTQFANSLNLIRSSLMTAFMPIYQAILPAINTLMSALATATAYIASFISNIFGKTYQQSINAAKAMQTQVGALTMTEKQAKKTATSLTGVGNAATAAGNAAKKAAGGLAGFDEINKLGGSNAKEAGSPGSGVITPITPMANMSPIEETASKWADGFKKVLSTIFQPFKVGWEIYGSSIVSNIESVISNITHIFKVIGTTIEEVWGARGQGIVNTFYGLLQTGSMVLKVVSKFMRDVWDNGGQYSFQKILEFGASIIELAGKINERFVQPFIKWFSDNIEPKLASSVGNVNKVIGNLFDKLTNFIDWLSGDGKSTLDTIVIVLGSFAIAWGAVTLAMNIASIAVGIWNVIAGIGTTVTTLFGSAVAFLTSPITIAILIIGSLIAIGILLYKNWDTVSAFLINIWYGIKTAASTVWNAIVTTIKNVFNGIGQWFSNVFTSAWNGIKSAFSSVGSFFSGVWNTIKNMFTSIGSTIGNGIAGAFKTVVNSIISFAENSINGFIRAINGAIKLINLIPGVNIHSLNTLSIPKLARGGVIDQPTLAMVGERGKEAVMPLENNTDWIDTLAGKLNSKGQSSDEVLKVLQMIYDLLKDLGLDINIDGDKFARATIKQLNKRTRMTGKTELII